MLSWVLVETHTRASPRLHVVPWDRPLPGQAAAWLAEACGWRGDRPLDLSDHIAVVSTRQSGRRLREALARHAAAQGQAVFPPRVVMPEQLISDTGSISGDHARKPMKLASRHDSLFAWARVLLAIELTKFAEVFPVPPPARTFAWASRLGRQLQRLQSTLAENGLRMADVIPAAGGAFPEMARWKELAALERLYDTQLRRQGLIDPQAARITRSVEAPLPTGVNRIHIVATPDPHPLAVRLLERWSASIEITVLVHGAPESADELFDCWGRPAIEAWARRPLDLDDFESRVHLCADPADQAARIVEAIDVACAASGDTEVEGLLGIGLADAEVAAPLRNALGRSGRHTFSPEGMPRRAEPLYELLRLLGDFSSEPSFANAARLARCPDVLAWLGHELDIAGGFSPARWLLSLDRLHARHLPLSLQAAREHARGMEANFPELEPGLRLLAELHEAMQDDDFANIARALPARILGWRSFQLERDDDARAVEAARAWNDVCDDVSSASLRFPELTTRDLWEVALQAFGESVHFPDKPHGAIAWQGWLELAWDDSPHLVVAGLNEQRVPTAIVGDAFLPESLRERLGLTNNAARLARDAYLLQAIVASRRQRGRCDLLLGKTSAAGDPLRPSRLLLTCGDDDLARRVAFLFREVETSRASLPWRRAWKLRPDQPLRAITRMSVTGFRNFLACPFRFYLRYGLRMEPSDPGKAELDARDFGNLIHTAVEALGRAEVLRGCADAAVLREFLLEQLDATVRAQFGPQVPMPVLVQLESARQRLSRMAAVQAQWHAEGWMIEEVERPLEFQVGSLVVTGRIDRIDRNVETGARRVLDYKTADKPGDPRRKHLRPLRRGETSEDVPAFAQCEIGGVMHAWTDLQLPLYLHAIGASLDDPIACGYFNLPKAANETAIHLWEGYTRECHVAAWSCAEAIAEAVAAGRLWPPGDVKPEYDDFASLFHHGATESVDWPSAEEETRP